MSEEIGGGEISIKRKVRKFEPYVKNSLTHGFQGSYRSQCECRQQKP